MSTARRGESGNALIELIFGIAGMMVPIAIGLVSVVTVANGSVLAETTAREVARVFVLADNEAEAFDRATRTAKLAFADAGRAYVAPRIACTADPCLTPGASVRVVVRFPVEVAWGSWTVRAEHVQVVDPWRTL